MSELINLVHQLSIAEELCQEPIIRIARMLDGSKYIITVIKEEDLVKCNVCKRDFHKSEVCEFFKIDLEEELMKALDISGRYGNMVCENCDKVMSKLHESKYGSY